MAGTALIVGVGDGISASFARLLARDGIKVGLAARRPEKLEALRAEIGGVAFGCDVTEASEVERLFAEADAKLGALDVVHYNPSYRVQGPLIDLDPEEVRRTLMVSAYGGFLVAQQAARRMLRQGGGAILFTGASASVKGYAALGPVRDGQVRAPRPGAEPGARARAQEHPRRPFRDRRRRAQRRAGQSPPSRPDSLLDPDAIAQNYLAILKQPRSAWSWEVELRPWVETF